MVVDGGEERYQASKQVDWSLDGLTVSKEVVEDEEEAEENKLYNEKVILFWMVARGESWSSVLVFSGPKIRRINCCEWI